MSISVEQHDMSLLHFFLLTARALRIAFGRDGLAGSTVLDPKAPLMLDRKFNPGFQINLHIKDPAKGVGRHLRNWRCPCC